MQRMAGRSLVALCLLVSSPTAQADTNPLGRVVDLLTSLTMKVKQEGEAELKAYKEFTAWCDDAARNKQFEIKTATAKNNKLEAEIGRASGDIEASAAKIEELASSMSADDADLRSATAIREKEAEDFAASEKELMEVVDTLGRSITVLEREMAKNPASFTQVESNNMDGLLKSLDALVDAASLPSADKTRLMALVQAEQGAQSSDEDFGAPAAAVYKTHSTNILDVLEDLKEKAEEQLSSVRKAETNAKHNYEMLKQSLKDQMSADSKSLAEEKSSKSGSAEAKATAEGELARTVKDLDNAKKALQTSQTDCMQTAADHEATVKSREEELAALAKAKEIIMESSAGAVKQAYSLMQFGSRGGSRLQTRADLANAELVNLVKRLAKQHHSAALAQLASRISAIMRFGAAAGEDPFAKVKGLIADMIAKLEQEQHGEATEKAYCDEQTAKTEAKKSELDYDISKLTAKIDKAVAKSASTKADIKETQAELAALAKQQAEMDRARTEGHAAYTEAKADLEAGLEGVRKAISVLREYYGSSAASLLQRSSLHQPDLPEMHTKATGAGSSIIGILEVVESDFAKTLATEETEEDSAETEYQQTTQENKVTATLKNQDVKYLTQESKTLDKNIAELTADRDTSDAELSAVMQYYAQIKERCIAKPEAYEDRKKRREAEIQGLKQALAILRDEVAMLQHGKRGGLRGAAFLGNPGQ